MSFSVLILDGAYASSVSITLDMLTAAEQLAPKLGLIAPRWKVYGFQSQVALSSGMKMKVQAISRMPKASHAQSWVIPGLGLQPEVIEARLSQADAQKAASLLAQAANTGSMIQASCSATLLLAKAGLLQGKKVTTTWWLAAELQRIEPNCSINLNRLIVRDGQITTAGAALAQTDLMLHILKESHGIQLAQAVARVMLIDQRKSQAHFIVPAAYTSGNEFLAQLTQRMEAALPVALSMEYLAKEFNVSTRTLARHVKAAAGLSPLALLQSIRIHKAQVLLSNSRLSVEDIAARVGYTDATALRRLLKVSMQATPRQLRYASYL